MTISAKVILDSRAPNGARLTTFELIYPRLIHAELMTHRVLSRNAASSRAIPTPKKIERIREDTARPSEWGTNMKGMQAAGPLPPESAKLAQAIWDSARDQALEHAEILCGLRCENCNLLLADCTCGGSQIVLNLHKQVANRLLEPFDHICVVVTTTKLNNHWKLRLETDPDTGRPMADPTYFELATKWKAAFDSSVPYQLKDGEWHLPYVSKDHEGVRTWIGDADITAVHGWVNEQSTELQAKIWGSDIRWHPETLEVLKKVSVGRVARTSYMRQGEGDIKANIELHDRLASAGHWSPFEAVATPIQGIEFGTLQLQTRCGWCWSILVKGDRVANITNVHQPAMVCQKCALGHVTSGNFCGWKQYRKEFPDEAGGD